MSINPNVTEEVLINLDNLAYQQKSQRAIKIELKFEVLKQTHEKK